MPRQQVIGVEAREVGGGCGVGLVAAAPLQQGTVVLQERPYATALLPSLCPVACRTCFAPIGPASKGLQTCGRCRAAHYCSYKCLRLDRRPHRESGECWTYGHAPALTLAAPEELHREVCLALRHMYVQEGEEQQQQQAVEPESTKEGREIGHQGKAQDQQQQQHHQGQQQLKSNASVLCGPLHGELCAWQEAALSWPGLEALWGAVGQRAGLGLLAGLLAAAAQAGLAERATRLQFEARREQARQQRQTQRQQRKQQREQQQQQHEGKQQQQEERNQQRAESKGGQVQRQMHRGGQGSSGEERIDSKSDGDSDTESDSDTDYEAADVMAGVGTRVPGGREGQPQRPPHLTCDVDGQVEVDPWAGGAWATPLSTRAVAAGADAAAAAAAAAAFNAPPPVLEAPSDHMPPANARQHKHDQQDNQQRGGAAEGSCNIGGGGGDKRSSGSWVGVGGGGVWARAVEALCVVLTNALEVHPQLQPPAAAGLMGMGRGARQGPAGTGNGVGAGGEVPAAVAERLSAPLALYRLACRLNHSCRPNAAYHFRPGGAVLVRTLCAVPRGGQVAIAYVDLAQTRVARREELHTKYGFWCRCERCDDGTKGSADGGSGTESEGGCGPTSLTADQLLAGLPAQVEAGVDAKGDGAGNRVEGEAHGLHGVVRACQQQLRQAGGSGELLGEVYKRLLAGLEQAGVALEGCSGSVDGPQGAAAGCGVRGGRAVPHSRCCVDAYTLAGSAARRCARLAREQRAGTGAGGCRGPAEAAVGSGNEMGKGAAPGLVAGAGPIALEVRWWMRAACSSLAGAAAAERLLGAEPALLQHAACCWGDVASTACELLSALFGAAASGATVSAPAAAAAPAATNAASVPAVSRSQTAAAPAPLTDLVCAVRAALERERSEQLSSCRAAARAVRPRLHSSCVSDEGGARSGAGEQGAMPGRKRPAEEMHQGSGVGGGDGNSVSVGKRPRADGEEESSRDRGSGKVVTIGRVKGSCGREEGGGCLWPRYSSPPIVARRMRRLFMLCGAEGAWGSAGDGGSCQPAGGTAATGEVAVHQQQQGEERDATNSTVVEGQGTCRALLAAVDDWCSWVDQEHSVADAKDAPPHGGALSTGPLAAVAAAAAVALCHALARVRLLLVALLGEAHGCCEAAHFMPFFAPDVPYHVAAELCELAATLLDTVHRPYMGDVHVRVRMHGQAGKAD